MKFNVAGIIAEYNPFHNGHLRLLNATREAGATHIVAVMSGNFVQRGEPAAIPKFIRAEAAIASGIDLVLELPLPYAMATAQHFAQGSIYLLGALGNVQALAFGSESGEIEPLQELTKILQTPTCSAEIKRQLKTGITYAKARQNAVASLGTLLETPNNTLAIEYLTALSKYNLPIKPFTIKRDIPHDSNITDKNIASATFLRKLLSTNLNSIASYIPSQAFNIYEKYAQQGLFPANPIKLENAILSTLRSMDKTAFHSLPDLSEGIDERFYKAVRNSISVQELLEAVKTKRYPLARIRRMLWNAFLNVPGTLGNTPPPYLRILAMNTRGKEILANSKPKLPISASLRDLERFNNTCAHYTILEASTTDLYSLTLPIIQPCGIDYRHRLTLY